MKFGFPQMPYVVFHPCQAVAHFRSALRGQPWRFCARSDPAHSPPLTVLSTLTQSQRRELLSQRKWFQDHALCHTIDRKPPRKKTRHEQSHHPNRACSAVP